MAGGKEASWTKATPASGLDEMLRPVPHPSVLQSTPSTHQIPDNIPEVSSKVDHLPGSKPNQHAHGAKGKPFDSFVGALVGVSEFLLAHSQVLQLLDNLIDRLFYPPQLGLDRLEFLRGLDRRPVTRVRANVNVEFDVADRIRPAGCFKWSAGRKREKGVGRVGER